jgi:hypothetical protein
MKPAFLSRFGISDTMRPSGNAVMSTVPPVSLNIVVCRFPDSIAFDLSARIRAETGRTVPVGRFSLASESVVIVSTTLSMAIVTSSSMSVTPRRLFPRRFLQ